MENLSDAKVKILVGNTELIVDLSDIDKANPSSLDRCSDIAFLKCLNETSALHLLRQRYGSNLHYINGGVNNMIFLKPFISEQDYEYQKRVYKENLQDFQADNGLINLLKNCRKSQMPAHLFAMAKQIYR